MIRHWLLGLKVTSRQPRRGSRVRRGRGPWVLEGLEGRMLLSGNPPADREPVAVSDVQFPPSFVALALVQWGTSGSAQLQTATDGVRLLPAGRNTDLPWLDIRQVQVLLDLPATLSCADVTVVGAKGKNYGPVTVSGSGVPYTLSLAQPITKPDRVTITIGNADIIAYTRRLDVLPGDLTDDGVVNQKDVKGVHNQFKHKGGPRRRSLVTSSVMGRSTPMTIRRKASWWVTSCPSLRAAPPGGPGPRLARQHATQAPVRPSPDLEQFTIAWRAARERGLPPARPP